MLQIQAWRAVHISQMTPWWSLTKVHVLQRNGMKADRD